MPVRETVEDHLVAIELALTTIGRHLTRPRLHDRVMRELGVPLDRAGAVLLRLLDELGDVRLSDLATAAAVDVSTLSRQVSVLVHQGLVARATDPLDGRASRLTLTPDGRRTLDRLAVVRRTLVAELLTGWSATDRAALAPLLDRLAADLGRFGS